MFNLFIFHPILMEIFEKWSS